MTQVTHDARARSTSTRTQRGHHSQPLLLRGFAPLVVAVVLLALGVLLVPSVAPEQVVIRRDEMTTTSPPPTLPPAPAAPAPAPAPVP